MKTIELISFRCFSPFPEVAEAVQEELDTYRAQEDEVKRLKSIMVRHKDAVCYLWSRCRADAE